MLDRSLTTLSGGTYDASPEVSDFSSKSMVFPHTAVKTPARNVGNCYKIDDLHTLFLKVYTFEVIASFEAGHEYIWLNLSS